MENKMNVYEKLQSIRVNLQASNLKKSGKNKFANFDYFELPDITPTLNKLLLEHKATTIISFNENNATLKFIDCDKPEDVIEFYSKLEDAAVKGCTPIQNLGSQQTYTRRYLYLTAFDIAESDSLDPNIKNPLDNLDTNEKPKPKQDSKPQAANDFLIDVFMSKIKEIDIPDSKLFSDIAEEAKKVLNGSDYKKVKEFGNKHYNSITNSLRG